MLEQLEYTGCTIKIETDVDPMNPREWEPGSTMVCFHGKYKLGDKHDYKQAAYGSWDELKAAIQREEGQDVLILPLYLYDHSGITMATKPFSCQWDSGQVGFIFNRTSKAMACNGWTEMNDMRREIAMEQLQAEVEAYDKYLTGQIYCYSVYNFSGELIDSLCGLDDMEYAKVDAMSSINNYLKSQKLETLQV